jgi:hypothetical protein
MNKKYIQLPRTYLSYSQMVLWQSDPRRYEEIYMDGRDELRTSNSGQEYGKVVATALEHGRDTGDLLTDSALLLLPKYDVADQEIRVDLKTTHGWLQLVGKPDTRNSLTHAFREYKTGKHPWTAKKAQDHGQMRFYAMLIYLKFGVLLKDAHLDWIETEQGEDGIRPTGRVQSFRVTFTLNDILKTMAEATRVALEIESAYAAHATKPEIPW